MSLLGAGLQSTMGLIKGAIGGAQALKASRQLKSLMDNPVKYEMPSAFKEYLSRTDVMARRGLPGEDIARERIGGQVGSAIGDISRSADSAVGAMGAMSNIHMKSMDALMDLDIRSAEYRAQMEQAAAGARKEEAMYQDKEWEYNKNIPYQRRLNMATSDRQAGMANLWGGLDSAGAGAVSGASSWAQNTEMQQMIDAIKGMGMASDTGGGGFQFSPSFTSRMNQLGTAPQMNPWMVGR